MASSPYASGRSLRGPHWALPGLDLQRPRRDVGPRDDDLDHAVATDALERELAVRIGGDLGKRFLTLRVEPIVPGPASLLSPGDVLEIAIRVAEKERLDLGPRHRPPFRGQDPALDHDVVPGKAQRHAIGWLRPGDRRSRRAHPHGPKAVGGGHHGGIRPGVVLPRFVERCPSDLEAESPVGSARAPAQERELIGRRGAYQELRAGQGSACVVEHDARVNQRIVPPSGGVTGPATGPRFRSRNRCLAVLSPDEPQGDPGDEAGYQHEVAVALTLVMSRFLRTCLVSETAAVEVAARPRARADAARVVADARSDRDGRDDITGEVYGEEDRRRGNPAAIRRREPLRAPASRRRQCRTAPAELGSGLLLRPPPPGSRDDGPAELLRRRATSSCRAGPRSSGAPPSSRSEADMTAAFILRLGGGRHRGSH